MPSGPRVRANNVFGTTVDNPLTAGATTLTSVELALLPEVASAHAILTLDPLRTNGTPEIIVVTAHAPGAQSATITRGAYGTIARQHPQGTVWVHAPVEEDVIQITDSSGRPSDPYEGQIIYEIDTDRFIARQSGAWVGLIPAGVISSYGGSNAPVGWLLCDGTAVSRTTYADLFATLGTVYGVGDGSTTFNLPNLQDRFPLGKGSTFTTLGATGGSATSTAVHTHDLANHTHSLASHTHNLASHSHTHTHQHTLTDNGHNHGTGIDGSHTHSSGSQFVITHNADPFRVGNSVGGTFQQVTFTTNTNGAGSHQHTINNNTTGISIGNPFPSSTTSGPSPNTSGTSSPNTSGTPTGNTSGASSVGAANGNMPPYQIVNYIVKH